MAIVWPTAGVDVVFYWRLSLHICIRQLTSKPWNPLTSKPWNPLTSKPWNPLTSKPWNPLTSKPWNPLTSKPWNPLTSKPRNPLTSKPRNPLTSKPRNPLTSKPRNPLSLPTGTVGTRADFEYVRQHRFACLHGAVSVLAWGLASSGRVGERLAWVADNREEW